MKGKLNYIAKQQSIRKSWISSVVYLSIPLLLASLFLSSYAIEIPIDITEGKKTNIAFVDMEVVYNLSPKKSELEKEITELKNNYETRITSLTVTLEIKKNELNLIIKELETPTTTTQSTTEATDPSTTTVVNLYEKELSKKLLTEQITRLEKELSETKQKMSEELASLQKKGVSEVLEHIYKILENIALEEGLTLIIDKNYILYSPSGYDITDKVIKRLK